MGAINGKGWKRFMNQGKDDQEGIDNFVLVVGSYNHDSCIPVANSFTINLGPISYLMVGVAIGFASYTGFVLKI